MSAGAESRLWVALQDRSDGHTTSALDRQTDRQAGQTAESFPEEHLEKWNFSSMVHVSRAELILFVFLQEENVYV